MKENWTDIFKNKMNNHKEEVPEEIWDAVKKHIPKKRKGRPAFLLLFLVMAIPIGFLFSHYILEEGQSAKNDIEDETQSVRPENADNNTTSDNATIQPDNIIALATSAHQEVSNHEDGYLNTARYQKSDDLAKIKYTVGSVDFNFQKSNSAQYVKSEPLSPLEFSTIKQVDSELSDMI